MYTLKKQINLFVIMFPIINAATEVLTVRTVLNCNTKFNETGAKILISTASTIKNIRLW